MICLLMKLEKIKEQINGREQEFSEIINCLML